MAFNVSTNTQAVFLDSRTRAGTVLLPSTFTVPGRTLIFKDQVGAFSTNTLTLTTNNANQTIDSLITSTINNQPLGWQSFIAGNNNRWYTVGGTVINTINTSTVNTILLRSVNISSANMFVSSLGIVDQTFRSVQQLYVQSSFLYYSFSNQSTIISGTRQSFGGLFTPIRRAFAPNQLTGLNLWLDASDPNTFAYTTRNVLTNIFDKSGARSIINTFDGTSVVYEQTGLRGLPSFNTVNGHFRGTISTSRPMTRYTNTIFIVTQLITQAGDGFPCMALSESLNGSTSNVYRALDYRPPASGNIFRVVSFFTGVTVTFGTAQVGAPFIQNANYNAAANGNTLFMRYNGDSSAITTQNVATAPTTTATNFFIGSDGFTSVITENRWPGRISEVLMYNVQLTIAQQEQVEGYLAWKWNLVGNLPASHPFKNAPP